MHTTLPFYRANERALSDRVAVKHYDYLKRGLERAGIASTPYNIALAWNGGLQGVVTGKSPRVAHDYAHRAANLTEVFASRQRIASAR